MRLPPDATCGCRTRPVAATIGAPARVDDGLHRPVEQVQTRLRARAMPALDAGVLGEAPSPIGVPVNVTHERCAAVWTLDPVKHNLLAGIRRPTRD